MKSDIRISVKDLFIFLVLFLGILPVIEIAGFGVPFQFFLLPFFFLLTMLTFLTKFNVPPSANILIIIWLIVIVDVLFTSLFGPILKTGSFDFPTESIQYISRFLFFFSFIVIFYNYDFNPAKFMRLFIVILLIGMFVGVFQFFNLPGSNLFQELYSFSEKHLNAMNKDVYASKRVSGVAQFATSNGGIAVFTLILVISFYMFYKKKYMLTLVGIALCVFNVVASQARMGYLTLAFAIATFFIMYTVIYKRGIKPIIYLTVLSSAITFIVIWLYNRGNPIVDKAIYRWKALGEEISNGENRIAQINSALNTLSSPWDYLFGTSNSVYDGFIEIEPVNIFILYGGIGFLLQYILILALLIYFFRNIKFIKKEPILLALVAASFISLLSYQFFSLAYYFFREIRIGLFPWILMGASIGMVERYKKLKKFNPNHLIQETKGLKQTAQ